MPDIQEEEKNMHVPRIMIAAMGSGSGKTTVICALLEALSQSGKKAASFKCRPDYIDPMFPDSSDRKISPV